MDFKTAVEFVLKFEGGLSNNIKDSGGLTNFGISQRSYPTLDIAKLTRAKACMIYKADYWDAVPIQVLPDKMQLVVFDAAVQHGIKKAVGMLQASLGCDDDGIIGASTLAMINLAEPVKLFKEYILRRHTLYTVLRNWEVFGKGWSKRLLEIAIVSGGPR